MIYIFPFKCAKYIELLQLQKKSGSEVNIISGNGLISVYCRGVRYHSLFMLSTWSCLWVCYGGGGSYITVNYHYHTDLTLDCTQHNTDTFGLVYLIVPLSDVFSFLAGGSRKS